MSYKKIKSFIFSKPKIILVLFLVLFLGSYFKSFGAGGTGPFLPGAEIDPDCIPGSINCYVISDGGLTLSSPIVGFVSNTGIISDTDSLLGALNKLDGNINSKISSQWTSSSNDIYFNSGRVWIGSDTENTSSSSLYISGSTSSAGVSSAISGILGNYTFDPILGGVQVGNRYVINNNPTSLPNTAIGSIFRVVDNTSLANLVRGVDIVSSGGTNTLGVNTGLRASGATFGIQGITNATAGGVYVPAAIYGENTNQTQGDILRLYSVSMTTAPAFATFYHEISDYSGTGLLMDFATGSGTFSGNFVDFQNNNASMFKVTSDGILSMGLSSTSATSAICSSLPNGTAPILGVTYEIRDCSNTPVADYAEMYSVEEDISYGDIVVIGENFIDTYDTDEYGVIDFNKVKGKISKLTKSSKEYQENTIGIVSKNYGDFSSVGYNIKKEDNPMPVALNGRVPVKISSSSESIKAGDYLTTSTDEGKAMKATDAGFVIGKSLQDWDGISDTVMVFIEQGYRDTFSVEKLDEENNFVYNNILSMLSSFFEIIKDKIIFKKIVVFNQAPVFSSDTAGNATILSDSKTVNVYFDYPYQNTPIILVSLDKDGFDKTSPDFIVTNKSGSGFDILLENELDFDVNFSWIALYVENPKESYSEFVEEEVIETSIKNIDNYESEEEDVLSKKEEGDGGIEVDDGQESQGDENDIKDEEDYIKVEIDISDIKDATGTILSQDPND